MKWNDVQSLMCIQGSLELPNLEMILDQALSRGGDYAEIFYEDTVMTRVLFEDGKVDRVATGRDLGVSIRVIGKGRTFFGYSTDLSSLALETMASDLALAVEASLDSGKAISSRKVKACVRDWKASGSASSVPRHSDNVRAYWSLPQKVQTVRRAFESVRTSLGEAFLQCQSLVEETDRRFWVFSSDGLFGQGTRPLVKFYVNAVAQREGRTESAMARTGGTFQKDFFELHPPEKLAQEACDRVLTLLRAHPAPSGEMTVIISGEAGGTMVHEAVGHGLEADLACNGLSVYGGKLGKAVASSLITVVDDGSMKKMQGSIELDDEANSPQKTVLIENGVLKSYMVDRVSAMKFDLSATGNGRRESFRQPPIVRMTNTFIEPGTEAPEAIIQATKQGVLVKSIGGGQVNTVTGDFVFGVKEAYLIRDGKIAEPIRGATLVGNGPKVLETVDRVGNDLGFSTGMCGKSGQSVPVTDGQPTLRIPAITVGGMVPPETYWK